MSLKSLELHGRAQHSLELFIITIAPVIKFSSWWDLTWDYKQRANRKALIIQRRLGCDDANRAGMYVFARSWWKQNNWRGATHTYDTRQAVENEDKLTTDVNPAPMAQYDAIQERHDAADKVARWTYKMLLSSKTIVVSCILRYIDTHTQHNKYSTAVYIYSGTLWDTS